VTDQAGWTAEGRPLLGGRAEGVALVLDEPLSFWGGFDSETGLICDERHPQRGQSLAGRVVVMPSGRGSSSSSSVLAQALRQGTGPVALLLAEPDGIIVLGALVPRLLDGLPCPVIVVDRETYSRLRSGDRVAVEDSRLRVDSRIDEGRDGAG
jgi:predicted aconitase with swiveling domain